MSVSEMIIMQKGDPVTTYLFSAYHVVRNNRVILLSFLISFFEALCIALALSVDAFAASFSYGTDNIRIPLPSVLVIDGICSFSIALTLLAGSLLKDCIPSRLTGTACFLILFLLGIAKLLDSITRAIIKKHGAISRNIHFSLCHFQFVLHLYADPCSADTDHSKTLSPKEAALLAIALSLDGCAVGFGMGLGSTSCLLVLLCSLLTEGAAVLIGIFLGNKAAGHCSLSISWVGGVLLLLLALCKLL